VCAFSVNTNLTTKREEEDREEKKRSAFSYNIGFYVELEF
jgi:hypothetical protein